MFWDWAEMEWLAGGEKTVVVDVILRSVGVTVTNGGSPAMVLRAKKVLDERIKSAIEGLRDLRGDGRTTFETLLALINLAAILELVSGDGAEKEVMTAMQKYDTVINVDVRGGVASAQQDSLHRLQESLALASTRLLYHYTRTLRAPIAPAILRTRAESLVSKFLDNTALLGIWLESERGEMVWGRVKRVVGEEIVYPSGEGVIPTRALWGAWQGIGEISRVKNMLGRVIEGERYAF